MYARKAVALFDLCTTLRAAAAVVLILISRDAAAQTLSVSSTVSPVHSAAGENPAIADSSGPKPPGIRKSVYSVTEPAELFSGTVLQASAESATDTEEPNLVIPPEDPGMTSIPDFEAMPGQANSSAGSSNSEGEIHVFRSPDDSEERQSFRHMMREPYAAYRTAQTMWSFLPGHGEDFGWLDWQTDPYLHRGDNFGVTGAINIHWLMGPSSAPLRARLYDFSIGFQARKQLSEQLSYDLSTSIGVYSDFEDSARDGVRYPSHAVGMFHLTSAADVIFGVDYPDRDDFAMLPVVGVSLRDVLTPGLRMDLVFPRPRIDYMLNDANRVSLSGLLGGGTWDIEFRDETNHIITYRDYRLLLGFEHTSNDGSLSGLEFGYVFGRSLEFRGLPGGTDFDEAFVIQWVSRH